MIQNSIVSQKSLMERESRRITVLPEKLKKIRIRKCKFSSAINHRELSIRKKARFQRVMEAAGKDKNGGSWHKLLT